jgi:hypothetical protein
MERERIREAKPDILLTNFMMLELLMTRQNALDRAVIANAHGLEYLVLDELHTYRGRQGADVAMLVRRVRDRLCPEKAPVCIGTSATMATEGDDAKRAAVVAAVASRLFGTPISSDAVIGESLERATDRALKPATLGAALAAAVNDDLPANLDDDVLYRHPLAVWCELEIGLSDGQRRSRRFCECRLRPWPGGSTRPGQWQRGQLTKMTRGFTPCGSSMAATTPVVVVGQSFPWIGTPMTVGVGHLCSWPPSGLAASRNRPRSAPLAPRQGDLRHIDIATVEDTLGPVHWDVDNCPVAMELSEPAAVEGP